jgi:hypothetical protein
MLHKSQSWLSGYRCFLLRHNTLLRAGSVHSLLCCVPLVTSTLADCCRSLCLYKDADQTTSFEKIVGSCRSVWDHSRCRQAFVEGISNYMHLWSASCDIITSRQYGRWGGGVVVVGSLDSIIPLILLIRAKCWWFSRFSAVRHF